MFYSVLIDCTYIAGYNIMNSTPRLEGRWYPMEALALVALVLVMLALVLVMLAIVFRNR